MKTIQHIIIFVISISLLVGCMNKSFEQKDMSLISPLKVVRHETPKMEEIRLGRLLLGAVLLGGVGAALSITEVEKALDVGELITEGFAERARKEIPNWPDTTIVKQPIESDDEYAGSPIVEFEILRYALNDSQGLEIYTSAELKDADGDILWKRFSVYQSKEYDRPKDIDKYKSDAKLLEEEVRFAADKTVSDLIAHFKGEK